MNRFVDIIGVGDVNIITVFGFKEDISPVRVDQSDLIFIFGAKDSLSDDFWNHLRPNVQVYGIGTKNYGQSNGSIYRHRFDPDYFDQTVPLNSEYEALNREWQKQWGDHYIDMIAYSTVSPGRIRVFSTDHKFISQDCEHLTRGGAQYYASIIDLDPFFYRISK